jgi:GntR family transcriptional repressor for pyruvate dehydrogenase complex
VVISRGGARGRRARRRRLSQQELEGSLLEIVEQAPGGIGSGALAAALRARSIAASQATVGRVLRALDRQSLTTRIGQKGRILTPDGRSLLEDARQRELERARAEQFVVKAAAAARSEFVDVLAALRIIEGNIAHLAAREATADQIATMTNTLEEERQKLDSPGMGNEEGTAFHALLEEACGNRFLTAAAEAIWASNESVKNLWHETNVLTGIASYPDHVNILTAIAAREASKAQILMERHFDSFIHILQKFTPEAVPSAVERAPRGAAAKVRGSAPRRSRSVRQTASPRALQSSRRLDTP